MNNGGFDCAGPNNHAVVEGEMAAEVGALPVSPRR